MSNVITGRHNVSLASRVLADLTETKPVAPALPSAEAPLDWNELDPSTLSTPIAKAYAQYVEARREAATLKQAFEDAMNASATSLPATHCLVFGYNFGKLSVAIAPKRKAKTSGASKSATSLADFLAAKRLSGSRT